MSEPEAESAKISLELSGRTWADVLGEVEREYFGHVLTTANGNKTKAAEAAGMPRETFYKRLRLFRISGIYRVD